MLRLLALLVLASAAPALAQGPQRLKSEKGDILVETVARGLSHPWGAAFLPDGRMLVTERVGRLRILARDGQLSPPLGGVPRVAAQGQGGLLDVALDPGFAQNRLVYLTYAEPREGGTATAAGRGRLSEAGTGLENFAVIFRQQPAVSGGNHFGSRLAFARDGKLFISTGERFKFDPAQDLSTHLGKLIRINPDGSVPPDNPFVKRQDAKPEIWSYGHRNVQGLAIHPDTGVLWEGEFGPLGGDEINLPEPARTTAGRSSAGAGTTTGARSRTRRPGRTSPTPSTTGRPRSRSRASPSTRATPSRAGAATFFSPGSPPRR